EAVDDVLVLRIGEDVRVIEGALPQLAIVVRLRPRRSAIVRAEYAAVVVLDERVHAAAVGAGNGHANPADNAGRQAGIARDLGPRIAAVGRFEQAAARSAARHLPGDAVRLP